MPTCKVEKSTGAVLNYLEAICLYPGDGYMNSTYVEPRFAPLFRVQVPDHRNRRYNTFRPTTDWAQGGPLAEAEGLSVEYDREWVYDPAKADLDDPDYVPDNGDRWLAYRGKDMSVSVYGPTELVAKMRMFVLLKLGDTVEIDEKVYKLLTQP